MLQIEKLSKYYNNKKVLDNISYTFYENNIYCIVGSSGSGKTTFLSILAGINKNYLGNIYYNNENIKNIDNYILKYIGFVFQNYQLFDDLTTIENIVLPLKLLDKDIDNYERKILYLLKYFDILKLKDSLIKDLSGGEKQRVALIRMLICDNKILLLDEPTSALDKNNSEKLFNYLSSNKQDKIIIIVSHDETLANKCDFKIDLSNKDFNLLTKVNPIINKEDKIKIKTPSSLKSKVFSYKKIYKIIFSYVLSFSLICICMCNVISCFINDVITSSFSSLNNNNIVSIVSNNINYDVDFNIKLHSLYDQIYYEGIESNYKIKLKEAVKFDYIKYNDSYIIDDTSFIFDNYLSNYKENIVLCIPQGANLFSTDINYLDISLNNKKTSIKIDKIYLSDDLNFYLYCNNVSYLNDVFKNILSIKISKYIYSSKAKELYNYLINDIQFTNYIFYLDEINNVILIKDSTYTRISYKLLNELIDENKIDNYIYSDFNNSYIDFDSGLIYIISNNEAIQILIDNNIKDNNINISSKYYELTKNDKSIKVNNTYLIVDKIIENNQPIVYLSSKTFNDLNDKNLIFSCILFTKNNIKYNSDHFIIKTNFLNINNFVVFNYILDFIKIYGMFIVILSFIAINVVFNINFSSKLKDIVCLYNLGISKNKIILHLLREPFKILVNSYLTFVLSYFLIKIAISVVYYQISNVLLDISFSLSFLFIVIFVTFVLIFIPLLIKLRRFFAKLY